MRIRFGYVSTALSLWDCSPSKTMTFTRWKQLEKSDREQKLKEITKHNLKSTLRMIYYNLSHELHLYRMSSSIVPLATHPEVMWDFQSIFKRELAEIGRLVKMFHLRVSFHPNQFTLFTSDKEHISDNAVTDMKYHYHLLDGMGLANQSNINIHVGGAYGDKAEAVKRFHRNIKKLPENVKKRMTLENDDKTYTTEETLDVCKKENIPMVFDYHHHQANLGATGLTELLPSVFSTWDHFDIIPKVHISSPKSEKEFRSHADYVDLEFILPFLKLTKELGQDYDIMIEAKQKDKACLQLIEDISKIRGVKRIDGGTVEW
ncbi:UV DNA damage repair endonuclease UvsE [Cytobacillus sp. S13-E01]|uniref:UV DNA damage repair endonuclease UvsE n=1 Tax=Cytobacillus sp. S13-E01 TaxID=3031326 RepID=UPI0023D8712B|nr:UV DNA damage repair endonuclease UvsE [Cytobacillus sp. S13-E01]MDF0726649.1 UV DNA damage repair endonuclease UvsE [Cytobacillus sp. S13-E01]